MKRLVLATACLPGGERTLTLATHRSPGRYCVERIKVTRYRAARQGAPAHRALRTREPAGDPVSTRNATRSGSRSAIKHVASVAINRLRGNELLELRN